IPGNLSSGQKVCVPRHVCLRLSVIAGAATPALTPALSVDLSEHKITLFYRKPQYSEVFQLVDNAGFDSY
ncbi:MAG: hypothetical protein ACK4UZ_06165, partial [Rhizobium rhizophilum]